MNVLCKRACVSVLFPLFDEAVVGVTCVCANKLPDVVDTGHRDGKRKQLISIWKKVLQNLIMLSAT